MTPKARILDRREGEPLGVRGCGGGGREGFGFPLGHWLRLDAADNWLTQRHSSRKENGSFVPPGDTLKGNSCSQQVIKQALLEAIAPEPLTLLCCHKMVHFPIFSRFTFQVVLIRFINNVTTPNRLPASYQNTSATCSLKGVKLPTAH